MWTANLKPPCLVRFDMFWPFFWTQSGHRILVCTLISKNQLWLKEGGRKSEKAPDVVFVTVPNLGERTIFFGWKCYKNHIGVALEWPNAFFRIEFLGVWKSRKRRLQRRRCFLSSFSLSKIFHPGRRRGLTVGALMSSRNEDVRYCPEVEETGAQWSELIREIGLNVKAYEALITYIKTSLIRNAGVRQLVCSQNFP